MSQVTRVSIERVPVRAGSEEYLDSEKYELKQRALDGPLLPLVARLNAIRREHPALRRLDDVTFLDTANEQLLAYLKADGDDAVLVVVNLDPVSAQQGLVNVPADAGLGASFDVTDLLTDETWTWHAGGNYVELVPGVRQAHVLGVAG